MFSYKLSAVTLLLFAVPAFTAASVGEEMQVGTTLNKKVAVPVSEVPAAVLAAVKAKRPELKVEEAEKEIRNNNQYFDIEGTDASGNEIELDLVLEDGIWAVVEIQRDIAWKTVPHSVQEVLTHKVPGIAPARIIESDQDNGMIIYEFFTRDTEGTEAKYEVSFEDEKAVFLTEEWKH
ncbi:hypothetical protein [Kordiimonas pumila]|uniref:Beta-lactamase-inhibitor-like PepSY-like domain-containing protein n=1 Tax=Kordiimonas pumila TaxID=2161677 RepID=A0ABV7DAW6_9PROT|nr:hypothetical protein [Kordiimonas pumila]